MFAKYSRFWSPRIVILSVYFALLMIYFLLRELLKTVSEVRLKEVKSTIFTTIAFRVQYSGWQAFVHHYFAVGCACDIVQWSAYQFAWN